MCLSSKNRLERQKDFTRKAAKDFLRRKSGRKDVLGAFGCGKVKNYSDLEHKRKTWGTLVHELSRNITYMKGFPICFARLPLALFSSHSSNWKKINKFQMY